MARNRLYTLILGFSIAGYILVFININEEANIGSSRTLCIFKTTTGIPCPACGTTRSISCIAKGQFHQAILTNPLGFVAALMLILSPLIVVYDLIKRKDTFYKFYHKTEQVLKSGWVAIPAILVILANWAWNIYKEI